MNTKDITGLMEAYVAVYDDDLRDELEDEAYLVQEDLSFIDDLSDNELSQIMESILSEGQFTLDDCEDLMESLEIYSDAVLVEKADSLATFRREVKSRREFPQQAAKLDKQRKATDRVDRIKSAIRTAAAYPGKKAGQAAEYIGGKARRAKALGGGAVSAVAGGARDVKTALGGKLSAAKKGITGFLGRVNRAARAGASAAKREFTGQAERESRVRATGRQMRRAARRQAAAAAAKDTSEFERPRAALAGRMQKPDVPPPLPSRGELMSMANTAAMSERQPKARSSGSVSQPKFGAQPKKKRGRRAQRQTPAQLDRLRAQIALKDMQKEQFDLIVDLILEDLIQEGYAQDFEDALDLLEDLSENEFDNLVESYLDSDVEVEDHYDTVMDYLLDEGFAESEEDAEVIMANMSDEWREEILDEAQHQIMSVSRGGEPVYTQSPTVTRLQTATARKRQTREDKKKRGKARKATARAEQARKRSIEALNSKPGEDPGDYDSGYYGDDDVSDGKRHYSLSHANRDARRRRASGR